MPKDKGLSGGLGLSYCKGMEWKSWSNFFAVFLRFKPPNIKACTRMGK
jgi:hypothetical protein